MIFVRLSAIDDVSYSLQPSLHCLCCLDDSFSYLIPNVTTETFEFGGIDVAFTFHFAISFLCQTGYAVVVETPCAVMRDSASLELAFLATGFWQWIRS